AATTPLLGAAAAVAALCLLTGAIHLDGLADSADGLLGRGDVAHRLEVMRDPRLGSYGVTAIAAVLLLDVAAISSMSPARGLAAEAAAIPVLDPPASRIASPARRRRRAGCRCIRPVLSTSDPGIR